MNADPFRPLPKPEDYAADLRVWVAASGAALPIFHNRGEEVRWWLARHDEEKRNV